MFSVLTLYSLDVVDFEIPVRINSLFTLNILQGGRGEKGDEGVPVSVISSSYSFHFSLSNSLYHFIFFLLEYVSLLMPTSTLIINSVYL